MGSCSRNGEDVRLEAAPAEGCDDLEGALGSFDRVRDGRVSGARVAGDDDDDVPAIDDGLEFLELHGHGIPCRDEESKESDFVRLNGRKTAGKAREGRSDLAVDAF